jgi:drug/metabolite transporter (DMT)-like permease
MKQQSKAYIYALITIALWSTVASASKITLSYLSPVQLLFFSSLVSVFVLFCIIVAQNKLPQLLATKRSDIARSIGYGFLNPFAYYLVLFKAYDVLPAQQAQIINYTWALTLTLFSIPFLKQKVSKRQWYAVLTSYAGVLVIATKGRVLDLHFDNPLGVGFALASTVIWALYWVLNTKDSRDPVIGLFLNFLCAVPMIFLVIYKNGGLTVAGLPGLAGAGYIGIFEMGLSFVLWLQAMKLTENTARIANLIFLSPILSLFFIHYLVGEQIYKSTLVGLVLVLAGLGLQAFDKKVKQSGEKA